MNKENAVDPELERIRAQAHQLAANDPQLQSERLQIAEAQASARQAFTDLQWSIFFRKHSDIADNVANRIPLETYAISISTDGRVTTANLEEAFRHPDLAKQLAKTDRKPPSSKPTDADRKTLAVWCRKNRLLPNDGALRRLCELHGNGFEPYQLENSVASGDISLSGGAPEDIARWDREDYIARVKHLQTCSPSELRAAVRAEGQKIAQQTAQNEFEHRQNITAQMQAGYPPLPPHINRAWLIKKSSGAVGSAEYNEFRNAVKKFGTAQVTALLQQQ